MALPAIRDEMQAQIGATSDKIERGLLVDALSSIEEAKESDVKKVGSVVSDHEPLFKVGDKVFVRGIKHDHTIAEVCCVFAYIVDSNPPALGGGKFFVQEEDIELQTPRTE